MSFRSTIIIVQTHTQTTAIALPGPLKWSVKFLDPGNVGARLPWA